MRNEEEWGATFGMSFANGDGRHECHGTYRGVGVLFAASSQHGEQSHRAWAIMSNGKPIRRFASKADMFQFIDKMLTPHSEVTMQEILRLRALCENHHIDPDWPLPDEFDAKVNAL